MCLYTIKEQGKLEDGVGYKVFKRKGRAILSEYRGDDEKIPTNKWLNEYKFRENFNKKKDKRILSDFNGSYKFGWHVFKDREDAKNSAMGWGDLVVYQVKYRKAHTLGTQVGGDALVVVAKEIKILEEVK